MGDYIFAKYLKFSKSNEKMSAEKALNIAIWNQELSEIVIKSIFRQYALTQEKYGRQIYFNSGRWKKLSKKIYGFKRFI